MPVNPDLGDLDLAALMSSKICHDLVGPVGAINNGLELLEEETDEQTRAYAFELINYSAQAARARLEFARLAFGASAGLGGAIDLGQAEKVARAFVEEGKHRLRWEGPQGCIGKNAARLVMMLIAASIPAIPGGGEIFVTISGQAPAPAFTVRCQGRNARIPARIEEILSGGDIGGIDPRSILPYYAGRLASGLDMAVSVRKDGADVIFSAAPAGENLRSTSS